MSQTGHDAVIQEVGAGQAVHPSGEGARWRAWSSRPLSASPEPAQLPGPARSPYLQGRVRARRAARTAPVEATYAGIDVSKQHLDVALWPGGEAWQCAYDQPGLDALTGRLRALRVTAVVVEGTGGLEAALLGALGAAGLAVVPREVVQTGSPWKLRVVEAFSAQGYTGEDPC